MVRSGSSRIGRDETRQRVLDAAERLFLTRGFLAVTVEDIANRAGFTRGAVYSNFAGKDDLMLALIERRAQRQMEDVAKALAPAAEQDRIGALSRWLAVQMLRSRDWSLAELEFAVYAANQPHLAGRAAALQQRLGGPFAEFLDEQCRAIGVTPPFPPDALATMIAALARGLMIEWLTDPQVDATGILTAALTQLLTPTGGPSCP